MKNIAKISAACIASVALFASCVKDETIVPELSIFDQSEELVLSLNTSGDYVADYIYYQYLDTSSPADEQMASPKFMVASNLSWRIVPEEEYDWIDTFPDCGESNGLFYFRLTRYNDQTKPRSATFRIVANDGKQDIVLSSNIVVNQSPSVEFVKKSAAKIEFSQNGGTKKLYITANVPWAYDLVPDADLATEDLDWLTARVGKGNGTIVDTLEFKAPANESSIRGAKLTLKYTTDGEAFEELIPVTQSGPTVEVEGFPIKWTVGVSTSCNYNESWAAEGTIASTTGVGTIRYVSADKSEFVGNTAFKTYLASTTTVDPAAQGVWPGDYLQFVSDTPVAKGTILKISFETRVSASCQKYWMLQYKDGNEWRPAGDVLITEDTGTPVKYTDAFVGGSDTKSNLQISRTVKYQNTTDKVDFRFVCVANWKCNGGALDAPNTASWRLTLTTRDVKNEWQPQIQCIAGGTESIVSANVNVTGVNDNLIVFEGTPEAPATFKVTSDNDFTISTNVDWLTLSTTEGVADTEYEVAVTCDNSTLSVTRKGVIDIASGISHYKINVLQSAAGQDLKPFISLVGGNSLELGCSAGEFEVETQSNVDYEIICPDWIQEVAAPETRSLVDYAVKRFAYNSNVSANERNGEVRFVNSTYNIESVLRITQANMSPEVTVDAESKTIQPYENAAVFNVTTNVPLNVTVSDPAMFSVDSATLAEGTTALKVNALSQADGEGTITLATEDGGYSVVLNVKRVRASLLADWCFVKADKNVNDALFASAAGASAEEGTMGKALVDKVTGSSTLEYWSIDKSEIDTGKNFGRFTSANAEPYVKGPWLGDYWLFTVDAKREVAAGTKIAFTFYMRNSTGAQKYWTVEYLDGTEWKPVWEMKTATEKGIADPISYNMIYPNKAEPTPYSGEFTISNAMTTLMLRIVAGVGFTAAGKVITAPSSATSRISSENGTLHNIFEICE